MFPECYEHNGAYRAADGFASMCQAFAFLVMHSLMPAGGLSRLDRSLDASFQRISRDATLTTVNDESERKPRRKEPVCDLDRVGARQLPRQRERFPLRFRSLRFSSSSFSRPARKRGLFAVNDDAPSVGESRV